MSVANRFIQLVRQRDWRIWFGLIVTFIWISGGIWFVRDTFSTNPGQILTLESVGGFLEGAFAPLAFLWLVLGLFIQQRELARHADELQQSTMNARQDTFFKIAENVKNQLGGVSGMLFMSGLGPVGSARFDREEMDEYFTRSANGDCEVFARQFLSMDFLDEGGLPELLYGTEIRRGHCRNFRRTFERLLAAAEDCDVDGLIVDSLKNTAFGLLYSRMNVHMPDDFDDG